MDIRSIIANYDNANLTIACLGGHSALDVCEGAKKMGFKTLVVARKGRHETYERHYRTRSNPFGEGEIGIIDEVILVDDFNEILCKEIQEELRKKNAIFIHNRYFWVYFKDFNEIEKNFKIPIYGTREMLKLEERNVEKNQYYLLEKAGIRIPKIFAASQEIDRLAIVKVNEAARGYERAFFLTNSEEDFRRKSMEMIDKGTITKESLNQAVIEEYVLGAHVNFNYFYSPLTGELELMGTDTRRQTNLDGFLRLPADEQLNILKLQKPKMVETGHIAVTTKESIIEKIFAIGERFVATAKKEVKPGIIGPFALQGAVVAESGKEDIVIFDVSMRIPGSPGTRFTPHTSYLYREPMSYGERIALEIRLAIKTGNLSQILT